MAKKTKNNQPAKQSATTNTGASSNIKKNNSTIEEKVCLGLLVCLIILIYIIRSKFINIPFERDEGSYCYNGLQLIDGKIPYKDFYEMKFPGIFYLYAFVIKFFGETVQGVHTGFMWINILSIVFVYLASRKMFSPIAGIISATTMAFVSLTPSLSGFTTQSEHGVALFISLGLLLYAYARSKNHFLFYLFAGACMAMAVMIKTTSIFMAVWGGIIIVTEFLFEKEKKYKYFFKNIAAYSVGGFLIVGIFFLIIIVKGGLNEMLYWTFEYSKKYTQLMPFEEGVKYFKYTRDAILQNHKFFWYHSILALAVCLFRFIPYQLKAFGITLLACSFLTIVPGYFFYGHYWIQVVPGLAVVAGLTYHCIKTAFEKLKLGKFSIKYIYLTVFGILVFNHTKAQKSYYFHPNYELILRQTYGNNPFPEAMKIGDFINANTKPEDNIVLLGSEPEIYFYTKKRCPSRHFYFTALVTNVPEHKEWQRQFVKDTEKANPKYLVYFDHQISLMVQPNVDHYVFEWANEYVTKNYKLVGLIDMTDGQRSKYLFGNEIGNYQPSPGTNIFIYERNN
ncbi:MAG: glycosyltransferase family 39 protein [Bacteroidetes bacterium]|nr:glycosyltransferase family 39 protein [Bacteroidota bacterium]